MKVEIRRQGMIKRLSDSTVPISAGCLAREFKVSRQIIVKDIAQLRNNGFPIISCARGYLLEKKEPAQKVFKVIHSDEDAEKELTLIVELGGTVLDVFVYHKYYNQVKAGMDIKTKQDITLYLENLKSGKSSLLKNVTSGYHYHTVAADSEKTLAQIESALWECGFLAPLQAYEPAEMNIEIQK